MPVDFVTEEQEQGSYGGNDGREYWDVKHSSLLLLSGRIS